MGLARSCLSAFLLYAIREYIDERTLQLHVFAFESFVLLLFANAMPDECLDAIDLVDCC